MTIEENKDLVRRFYAEVMNAHDPAAAPRICAVNLVWHGAGIGDIPGVAAFQQLVQPFFTAFPDLIVVIDDMIAEGDTVVARYHWQGSHQGSFQGIPPTGKMITVVGTTVHRVENGKIAEQWFLEDILGMLQQLGAVPAPQQAPAPVA